MKVEIEVDVNGFLASIDEPALTPAQEAEVSTLVDDRLSGALEGTPPDALELVTNAVALRAASEVAGLIDPDPIALGIELSEIGARVASARISAGKYPSFSEGQRDMLILQLRRRVQALLSSGLSHAEMRVKIREFAEMAVAIIMGSAPVAVN